ncbi:hypothetical protein KR067_011135, partial [Drosophila pandora]
FGKVGYNPPNEKNRIYGCTGVAITPRHVLAPAHCVYCLEKKGAYNFFPQSSIYIRHRVEKIFIHPNFTLEDDSSNDIAVLRVLERFPLNCSIPLEDQEDKKSLPGRRLDVVGGHNSTNMEDFQAQAYITGRSTCQEKLNGLNITHNDVCGYIYSSNINLKGAALLTNKMVNGSMMWHLLGISTKGLYHTPDLFTIIEPYRKWISKI